RVDTRPHNSRLEQRPYLALEGERDQALLTGCANAERRSGDGEPLEENLSQWDFSGRAGHQSDLDEAAVAGEDLEVARDIRAADDVEHHVDSPAHRHLFDDVHEILFVVVDRAGCAQLLAGAALGVAPG